MTSTPPTAAGIQDAARHLAEARPAEAAAVLERLVADFPTYVTAYVLLAKAYEASGRDGAALEAWHHAYFLMPGSPLIVRERTRLLRTAPVAVPVEPGGQAVSPEPSEPSVEEEPEVESQTDPEFASAEAEQAIGEVDDLDTLIHQLETAPRIRPDPDFRDEGPEEDDEGLVSETLARIYAAQKQYAAAARAYDQLAEQHPDRAAEFAAKAAEMNDLAREA